jgi:hypothetical protein
MEKPPEFLTNVWKKKRRPIDFFDESFGRLFTTIKAPGEKGPGINYSAAGAADSPST